MNKFEKIVDYFIEYEILDRFNDIELKEGQGTYISKDSFCKIKCVKEKIMNTKANKIKALVNKIKFKKAEYSSKILPDILQLLVESNVKEINQHLQHIIDEKQYCYRNNYDKDIEYISNIILDDTLIVLYPILSKGKKKIPLITFECKLEEDKYTITSYKIQQEAFRVIIASILNCEIGEVNDLLGNEFCELLKSLSAIQNHNIFEIIKVIDKDIRGKFMNEGFTSLWDIKNYEKWAVTEELVITIETFKELKEAIFGEELQHLKKVTHDSELPELIQKYLYANERSVPVDSVKNKFYYGSYDDRFSVNEKQWKVISAYNYNNLISVSGPPGTGKTTILKEIIADNFVRKIKDLINVWDEPWIEFGREKQRVFCSPFNGVCNKSMILTSTNNKAVDNIGLELLREVEYFSNIAKNELSQQYEKERLKGLFCARLGKKDNIDKFNSGALQPLIEHLRKGANYDEALAFQLIKKFKQILEFLISSENVIQNYIDKRKIILDKYLQKKIIEGNITIERVQIEKNKVQGQYEDLMRFIENNKKKCDVLENGLLDINKLLIEASSHIKENNIEIENIKLVVNKIVKLKEIPLIGRFLIKMTKIERNNGTQEKLEKELDEKTFEIKHYNLVKDNMIQTYAEKSTEIQKVREELKEQDNGCSQLKEKLRGFRAIQELIETFNSIKETYTLDCNWDDKEYFLFNALSFTKKRNQLFKLGLEINEAYIRKNSNEIAFNLEKVYADNWFQSFYRRDFEYDETYTKCIKAMWETVFLCFPIVTTTLHSFEKNKFHMIQGIFDTIMIDEAGQALLHTAVAPLFRARKAVIVGDIFQLEPIRGNKEGLVEEYGFDSQLESFINIESNSIQHAADRGADVYEILNEEKVGIILEEHRRCEKAIVEFSNRYVYGSRLSVVKQNEDKDIFKRNLSFIDVRGTKNRQNENLSEVIICKKIVELFLEQYGEEYKSKIGIISPFKNQEKLLKLHIPNIDIGTVHSFQGQEKELIILSTAIDDTQKNNGINFVGRKPNFLNVAFTRAKKQLVVVGNYEAYKNSNNYLMYAIETIEESGYIYSIYETNLIETIDQRYTAQFLGLFNIKRKSATRYDQLFKEYAMKGLIINPKNHYNFFINAMDKANKSVHIVSPWITNKVVDDKMIELIRKKVMENNDIGICFGYNKTEYNLDEINKIVEIDNFGDKIGSFEAISKLKGTLKENLKYVPPIHTKVLIIDEEFMVIGSHNWLSNNGSGKNAKDEISCILTEKEMIEYVKRKYF